MIKIIVFDSGWGGEIFADKLKEAVPVVEIERVIDWRRAPYSKCGRTEICTMTEKALLPYIGEVDVIVLASYAVSVAALSYLKWKYPHQKFVGFQSKMCVDVAKIHHGSDCKIMVLATGVVRESVEFNRDRNILIKMDAKLIEPNCTEWSTLVDDGEMTEERFRMELGHLADERIDIIMPYATGFMDMKPIFESVYGRRVTVTSDFERVIHETCMAIDLLGKDGKRAPKAAKGDRV